MQRPLGTNRPLQPWWAMRDGARWTLMLATVASVLWSGSTVAQMGSGDPEAHIAGLSAEAPAPQWREWVKAWLSQVADCEVSDEVPTDWVPTGMRTEADAAPVLADALARAEFDLMGTERVLLLLGETSHPRTVEYLLAAYEHAEELVDRALGRLTDKLAIDPLTEIDLVRATVPPEQLRQLAVDQQRELTELHQYRLAQIASVRGLSILGVGNHQGATAVDFLEHALADGDPRVRFAAAKGLARQPGFPGKRTVAELAAKETGSYKALLEELLYQ